MVVDLLKTTNKAAQIISLAVLLKLFSYGLNIKKAQSQQKSITIFLLSYKNHRIRTASTKKSLLDLQQEIPTEIWIRDENEFAGEPQRKCALKLEQGECQNVEYDYSVETKFSSRSLKNDFEEEIIDTFIRRINCPTPLHTELIKSASKLDRERTITIISSFPISKQKSNYLITAIRERIAVSAKIKFQIKKSITNRIELHDLGYKISWNVESYLTELDEQISTVLAEDNIAI